MMNTNNWSLTVCERRRGFSFRVDIIKLIDWSGLVKHKQKEIRLNQETAAELNEVNIIRDHIWLRKTTEFTKTEYLHGKVWLSNSNTVKPHNQHVVLTSWMHRFRNKDLTNPRALQNLEHLKWMCSSSLCCATLLPPTVLNSITMWTVLADRRCSDIVCCSRPPQKKMLYK